MIINCKLDFELHANQELVHKNPARFKVIKAGKRFGKSAWAGFELVQMAFREPGMYWYIAPTYGQAKEIMWDFLKNIIPKELMVGEPLNTELEIRLNLYDRGISKIRLKGADNESSLRGPALSGGIFDEAAYDPSKGYTWPNILRGQLAKSRGPFYFISSPHKDGKNWFTKLCEDTERRERMGDKDYAYWHFTIHDNPTLDKDEIEAIREGSTDDKWKLEYLAEESDYGGLLVSEFDYGKHVKEVEIPKECVWVRGIDWGIAHPTTCLWLAVDFTNKFVYVTDEYYKTDKLIQESASIIKQMSSGREFLWTVIDPSTAKRNSQTGRTDKDEFQRYGIGCIAGDNRDRGIDIMKMFFKENKILIHPKCKNLISELKNYIRGNGEGDDCLDPCFVAGTKIVCLDGEKKIEDVTVEDFVLTREGYKRVQANSITNKQSQVYELKTDRGIITGTFNHPMFMSDGSIKKLGELKSGDKLFDIRYFVLIQSGIWKLNLYLQPVKNSWGLGSTAWAGSISRNVLRKVERLYYCIGKFGSIILEKLSQDLRFITRIIQRSIIAFQISLRFQPQNIVVTTLTNQKINYEPENICSKFAILWRQSGMEVKMDLGSIDGSVKNHGKINQNLKSNVLSVGEITKLLFHLVLNFVTLIAVKLMCKDVKVSSVEFLPTKQPVYNLSIQETPEYVANGLLVHNCRYALVRIHDSLFGGNVFPKYNEEKKVSLKLDGIMDVEGTVSGGDMGWAVGEELVA